MSRLVGRSASSGRDNAAEVTDAGALKVDIGSATLSVTADGVEIKNDSGNPIPVVAGLSIPRHDYVELSYTGSDLTGVLYKLGGTWDTATDTYTGGATVGQLELVYSAGNLVKIAEV